MNNSKLILASTSPRRKELLTLAGFDFEVINSNQEEIIDINQTPEQVVKSLAMQKALSVFKNHPNDIVIGADTVVVVDSEIIGKPKDEKDAYTMIEKLQGKKHFVITGVGIISKEKQYNFCEVTEVEFLPLNSDEIKYYITHENVYDKAGSYAIQGSACRFIKAIRGDYYNVVGLPICHVSQILKELKIQPN